MRKEIISVVAALFIGGAPAAYAQQATSGPAGTPGSGRLSQGDFKMLTDIRVGVIKAALQLTPEQEKLWPAVEEAIRARAETRYRRLAALGERLDQPRDIDPVQLYRQRADVLTDRAAGLRKLADAWQPLYQSLTPDQKSRLRLVTLHALEGLRTAMENRRMEPDDEEEIELWVFPH
ncbi:Spy/CpxP family protein refolding chaperone [Microvirga terrae]|uniref:Spy/CpxP family protein refolding chaperone n=1 Tax=Microvirga terrae TaxID=2740529 RepID=A0ABY5RUX3_9HYPH|nr:MULTISPECIES: Spy/CpxP family protein refolding chaperone [Microvirga]MBQ0819854.1 Spy/CpxP family protein refolding chaperone [Microvirga sp. HBU67558]UVF19597.1 Spy/CpxP family protein refolding chaperone [Microvirga terrae]